MAGTKKGGYLASKTTKARHGEDFYVNIGSLGGSVRHPKTRMFYRNRAFARKAGKLGGLISRRGKNKIDDYKKQKIREAYEHLLKINLDARAEN